MLGDGYMRFAARTDKGVVRELNEDSFNIICDYPGVPPTFIIADGMGGHNSGEVASKMAVDIVSSQIVQYAEKLADEDNVLSSISQILAKANKDIYTMSRIRGKNFGMGTTVIVAVALNKKFFIAHVGDSRVYVIRDGQIRQITIDHSFIEELIRTGSLTREEAENHPSRNIITRALGCAEEVEIDTYSCEMKNDDIFILCTDGLTNMVSEGEIQDVVLGSDDPDAACIELIGRANRYGGEDNITVIVIDMKDHKN